MGAWRAAFNNRSSDSLCPFCGQASLRSDYVAETDEATVAVVLLERCMSCLRYARYDDARAPLDEPRLHWSVLTSYPMLTGADGRAALYLPGMSADQFPSVEMLDLYRDTRASGSTHASALTRLVEAGLSVRVARKVAELADDQVRLREIASAECCSGGGRDCEEN